MFVPETHTKRQATQHGSLPRLVGGGDKGIEIMYGEEKHIAAKAEQKYLVPARQTQQTNRGSTPFICTL
jgi:hypothetical protein